MTKTNYPAGSMGAAERKSIRIAKIIMGSAVLILFSLTYFGLFHTNLFMWMKKASTGAKIFGIIFYAATYVTLIIEEWISDRLSSDTAWYVIWFGLLTLAIPISAGFNFTL